MVDNKLKIITTATHSKPKTKQKKIPKGKKDSKKLHNIYQSTTHTKLYIKMKKVNKNKMQKEVKKNEKYQLCLVMALESYSFLLIVTFTICVQTRENKH